MNAIPLLVMQCKAVKLPAPTKVCVVCAKPFYAAPSRIKAGGGLYCSISCRSLAWSGNGNPRFDHSFSDRECLACHKGFRVRRSHVANGDGKYCSDACRSAAESVEVKCAQCAKVFRRPRSLAKSNLIFCGRACMRKHRAPQWNRSCLQCGRMFYIKPCNLRRPDKLGVGSYCGIRCKTMGMVQRMHGKNKRSKGGKRPDLGNQYFRSSWEANWARYLNWLAKLGEVREWKFESHTFEFHKIKRGGRFYTPDFLVTNKDGSQEFHEIKGYMDQRSATKLKRMAKYYPAVKVVLVGSKEYRAVASKVGAMISGWEGK